MGHIPLLLDTKPLKWWAESLRWLEVLAPTRRSTILISNTLISNIQISNILVSTTLALDQAVPPEDPPMRRTQLGARMPRMIPTSSRSDKSCTGSPVGPTISSTLLRRH